MNTSRKPKTSKSAIARVSQSFKILNGCGGNKGTKCGVEVYYMPSDSKLPEIKATV
jgi:hypothetical protein